MGMNYFSVGAYNGIYWDGNFDFDWRISHQSRHSRRDYWVV